MVAGASDAWAGLEPLLGGQRCGEGSAFFVLRPGPGPVELELGQGPGLELDEELLGYLGAAAIPVALARAVMRGEAGSFEGVSGQWLRVKRA